MNLMINHVNLLVLYQGLFFFFKPHGSYQIDVFKDFSGAVHLSQDDNHLIVYELLKLPQVTHHLDLQLCSDLGKDNNNNSGKHHEC